jgi:Glycosyl transferase family 2
VTPTVVVHVASINTRAYTELCLRTMWRTAGRPFSLVVGDNASTDGSAEMLQLFASRGLLTLQSSEKAMAHGLWIDKWRAECSSDYFVVVDSDVEFHRYGWLVQLLDETGSAAMVSAGREEWEEHTEQNREVPWYGQTYMLGPRPDPCVLALDHRMTREITTSFQWEGLVNGRSYALDTGGAFAEALDARGLRWTVMSPELRSAFTHHAGASSRARSASSRLRLKAARLRLADRFVPKYSAKAGLPGGSF